MNKLLYMSGLSALFLVAWAGSVFATAPIASAQGGGQKPVNVLVANTAAEPVPTTVSNLPAPTEPVTMSASIDLEAGGGFENLYTVPAGKRLVIECFTCRAVTLGGEAIQFNVVVKHNGTEQAWRYGPNSANSLSVFGSYQTKIYADAGSDVGFGIGRGGSFGFSTAAVTMSGYLEAEPPVAP